MAKVDIASLLKGSLISIAFRFILQTHHFQLSNYYFMLGFRKAEHSLLGMVLFYF